MTWDSSPGWEHRRPTGGWWSPERGVLVWRILKAGSRSVQKWCVRGGMVSFDRNLPRPPVATIAVLRDPVARYWAAVYQNHRGDDLADHLDRVLDHNRTAGVPYDCDGDLHFLDQHRFWPADEPPETYRLEDPSAFLTRMRHLGVDGGHLERRSPAPDRWKQLVAERVTDDDDDLVAFRYATDLTLWNGAA